MTFREYLEYILNKFKSELNYRWSVEIIDHYSCFDIYRSEMKRWYDSNNYLRITDRHYCFSVQLWKINELYEADISVETVYQNIKRALETDYLKQLWKHS